MLRIFPFTSVRTPVMYGFVILVFAGSVVFAASFSPPPEPPPATSPATAAQPVAEQPSAQSEVRRGEVIPLALHPHGFEPGEVTRPAGDYLVVVTNRSGLRGLTLQLNLEGGGRVREVQLAAGKRRWREVVRLDPGHYVLTVADHPEWVCPITITPR